MNDQKMFYPSKAYAFISYAHKNSDVVMPVINQFKEIGVRIWYDADIKLWSEWPEELGENIINCSCFICFITKDYIASEYCKREILFALEEKKNILPIYLEQVELSPGLKLQLCSIQAMMMPQEMSPEDFGKALAASPKIQACIGETKTYTEVVPAEELSAIKRETVRSITFLDSLENRPVTIKDVSSNWGSPTFCWAHENKGFYDVFLASDGGVIAPENSKNLFEKCTNLEKITFHGFNTSSVVNMSCMFYECLMLRELDLSGFDTSKVTDMKFMFHGCSNLKKVDTSGWNTSEVLDMGAMFQCCRNLEELDLSHFRAEKLKNTNFMFSTCSNLHTLKLSGWHAVNLLTMRSMFRECKRLQNIDLRGFYTSRVTDMGYVFGGCSSIRNLDVSSFDTSSVTDMEGLFCVMNQLEKVSVEHFKTDNVTNMKLMFYQCPKLQETDISSWNTSHVKENDYFMSDDMRVKGKSWKEYFPI